MMVGLTKKDKEIIKAHLRMIITANDRLVELLPNEQKHKGNECEIISVMAFKLYDKYIKNKENDD